MVRTKIVATLGPSSSSYEIVKKMIEEGVQGFRINFTQGEPRIWDEWIKIVREASVELDKPASIIGDIPGPQIRIGSFPVQEVRVKDNVLFTYSGEAEVKGEIPVPIKKFFETIEVGDLVLLDDGKVMLRITDVGDDWARAIVLNDSTLHPRKKIIVSGKEFDLPLLSDKDLECIRYSIDRDLSYIAVSFIRKPDDVYLVREVVSRYGGRQGIIAKIETRSAVNNLEEIVKASDTVLIARGDLGLHFNLDELPLIQRRIAWEASMHGKPCILSTQLLESMVYYPRPSRSEVVDVMTAVNDLVDALLLTSETAIGKYPVEAVKWLKRIVETAEKSLGENTVENLRSSLRYNSIREKYALGLTLLSEKINAKIIIYTRTGSVPPRISRIKPQVPVYVGASDKKIAEKLTIYYGLHPYYLETGRRELEYDEGVEKLFNKLRNTGEITYGEVVVESYGRRGTGLYEIRIKQVL